ncbi:unnamed protein product, partial [Rotaria sp. Silwood1]
LNDKLLVNRVKLIIAADNEFIIDNYEECKPTEDNDNDQIKPAEGVEEKPTAPKHRSTHQ